MLYIKGPHFSLPFPLALRYSVVAILLFTWHGVGVPTPSPRLVLIVHPFPSLLKRHGAMWWVHFLSPVSSSALRGLVYGFSPIPFPVKCHGVIRLELGFCSPRWEVAALQHGSVRSPNFFPGLNVSRCLTEDSFTGFKLLIDRSCN